MALPDGQGQVNHPAGSRQRPRGPVSFGNQAIGPVLTSHISTGRANRGELAETATQLRLVNAMQATTYSQLLTIRFQFIRS
jgi:hypothetical protein